MPLINTIFSVVSENCNEIFFAHKQLFKIYDQATTTLRFFSKKL